MIKTLLSPQVCTNFQVTLPPENERFLLGKDTISKKKIFFQPAFLSRYVSCRGSIVVVSRNIERFERVTLISLSNRCLQSKCNPIRFLFPTCSWIVEILDVNLNYESTFRKSWKCWMYINVLCFFKNSCHALKWFQVFQEVEMLWIKSLRLLPS